MRVTTTNNRTSKLQTPRTKTTAATTILNEQTGHLQNGTTIVSPTSSNNGTLRLIDSGDYLSAEISPQPSQHHHQPVTTSTMLQYLQPSSNAIQNMLIQQILTSPEQQRLLVEKINQQLSEQIQLNLVQPSTTTTTTTSNTGTANADVIKQIQNQIANQQLLLQQVSSKQQQQQQPIPSLFSISSNSNNSTSGATATVQYLTTAPTNSSNTGLNIIATNNPSAETRLIMPTATTTNLNRSNQQDSALNPLFQRNYCRWPSCDTLCPSWNEFLKHLNDEHSLDDRSVAQARVQQHVVQQLEALLTREREILQAMMKHLHGGNASLNSNGASSSSSSSANPSTTTSTATHIIAQPASRTLAPYRSAQLASPTSSSSTATNALHHLPIVKLENAYLTSAGLIKATAQDLSSTTNATTSSILRASASSSPPPVHTVEEEVGDDTNEMNDDDDDDANFLIQEEKPSTSKSLKLDDFDGRDGGAAEQDEAEDGQHGGLVKKMLDAKKMAKDGSEIAGQRSETKAVAQNDAQRRREREKIQKDVDKLRETIQSLTKSVVPLGKILEYLQEDYEMMAKEMQQYTDEYKRTVVELRKEKFATDQTLEPLRAAMLDFDEQIADMKTRIIFMKKKISNNEKANATRLLEIIRKTK